MRGNFVDRLYWFRAPITVGEKGMPALTGHDILAVPMLLHLRGTERFGDDVLEIYESAKL